MNPARFSLSRAAARARRSLGMSLVELLIATSVSGILASVAYPSFSGVLYKARRGEAQMALLQVQQAEERFRADGSRYGSLGEIGVSAAVPGGHYTLAVDAPGAEGYAVTAVAVGSQADDGACRYLRISVDAGTWSTASGPTVAAGNDETANRRCWNQ